jgi:hypothetical protein
MSFKQQRVAAIAGDESQEILPPRMNELQRPSPAGVRGELNEPASKPMFAGRLARRR